MVLGTLEAIVALAAEKRDINLRMALERDVRLVRCEDGKLELALEKTAKQTLINDLSRKLGEWTGKPWMVVLSREQGAPTLKSQNDAREAEAKRGVRSDPLVEAVLKSWQGAEIVSVSQQDMPPAADAPPPDESEQD